MNPYFVMYIGPMFGAKTTRTMAAIDREIYRKRKVIAFKAQRDKRYNECAITTHTGASYPAYCIEDASQIFDYIDLEDYNSNTIVAVDEAFMISNVENVLPELFKKGISIIVSSIQLDAEEVPFDSVMKLMPWATKIEVCPAVCTMCDQDAYYTEALFDIVNTPVEERVGGKEMYEPRCFKHYTSFNVK